MELLQNIINSINDLLWTYILIAMLIGCAIYFTWRTRFVQFRNLREMLRLLTESAPKSDDGKRQVSSFQAFAVSIASRVGTGNLAGVATAIAVGGAGAVFWMWVIALLGSVNAFVESTLAQLYKRKDKDSFIGGPAYYMQYGLAHRHYLRLCLQFSAEQHHLCRLGTCLRHRPYMDGYCPHRYYAHHNLWWYPSHCCCEQLACAYHGGRLYHPCIGCSYL